MSLSKVQFTSLSLALLTSCGSNYKRPESIEDKMARYKTHQTNQNIVPEIPLISENMNIQVASRGPASVRGNWDNVEVPASNKKLYFLTLFEQYQSLKKYSGEQKAPELNHCPSFHTAWLDYKDAYASPTPKIKTSYENRYKNYSEQTVAFYPELALPLSSDSPTPRVVDLIKSEKSNVNEMVNKGISIHLQKTYSELKELCNTGFSENYYTYENLTTHIQRKGRSFGPGGKSMGVLLKTTLFSNMALINSLGESRGRGPASAGQSQYDKKVMKKLNVKWAKGYFQAVKRLR